MAIVKNFWLKNQTKKLAGAVIYQAMGQTRSRELAASVSNPRTTDQMSQRVRWANLVNFYRANKSWMKFAYETKPTNRTDYNQFMSLNASSSRIYIPKSLANQGACVVDNYLMTQGSLASIENTKIAGGWGTNINMPDLDSFDDQTTIREVTISILAGNPAIHEGDQLSFIRFTQQVNSGSGVPFVVIRKYEVILSSTDIRKFSDFMPYDYIMRGGTQQAPVMEVKDSGLAGGWILILSRTIGGKTYVSTQSIVVANNSALIEQYSSDSALQAAIDSYGQSTEPFLTSTTAEQDSNAPVTPSILSVKVGTQVIAAGSPWYPIGDLTGKTLEITLSASVNETPDELSLGLYKAGDTAEITQEGWTIVGSKITCALNGDLSDLADYACASLDIFFEESHLHTVFIVPNEATVGGLE